MSVGQTLEAVCRSRRPVLDVRGGFLVALALGLALAGSAIASGGTPRHDFNSADQTLAKSIAITSADHPAGFVALTPTGPYPSPRCGGKPDESDLTLTGRAVSPELHRRGADFPFLLATVLVFRSAAQAHTAFERELRPTLPGCLTKSWIAGVASGAISIKLKPVSASLRPFTGLGVQAAVVRFVTSYERLANLRFEDDLFVLRNGRVEAWLSAAFSASKDDVKTRLTLEQPLLSKLAVRMRRVQ
jgi:hypothetical protein